MLAAELAGYSHPEHETGRLDADPKILQAIQRFTEQKITIEGVGLAYKRIISIVQNEATPPGIALKASIWLMETAGIQPASSREDGRESRALEDLSIAELQAISQEAKRRLETLPIIEGTARRKDPEQRNRHNGVEGHGHANGKKSGDLMG